MTKVAANLQRLKYFDKHIVIIEMDQLQIRKYWNVKTKIFKDFPEFFCCCDIVQFYMS